MRTYTLTVSTPDGNPFQGEVLGLYLRGADGDLAVLAGHTPLITSVRPGECRIELPEDEQGDSRMLTAHTDGGLLTVGSQSVTLLSSTFRLDEE